MYVIVVGGGKVGYYLSKHLLDRGYEVTLIEKDPRRADIGVALSNSFGLGGHNASVILSRYDARV